MIILLFLGILFAVLGFEAWLVARLTRTSARIDGWVAADERGEKICDAAEDGWAL